MSGNYRHQIRIAMKVQCNTVLVLILGIFFPVHCYSQSAGFVNDAKTLTPYDWVHPYLRGNEIR